MIQSSREPASRLAERLGINRKTVQKWRARKGVADAPRGRPKPRLSTVLTREEEAILVGFRRLSMLPLDDCLYALKDHFPGLTRSSLYRCFRRYRVEKLPHEMAVRRSASEIGRVRIDIGETVAGGVRAHVFVAADLATRVIYAQCFPARDRAAAAKFVESLFDWAPFRINEIVTVESAPAGARRSAIEIACARRGVRFERRAPDPIWTSMQLRRIADDADGGAYADFADLAKVILDSVSDYNFCKRLKILGGRTPLHVLHTAFFAHPEKFVRAPEQTRMQRGLLAP